MLIHMADHRGEGLDQVGSSPAPSSPKKMITVGDQIPRRGAGAHQSCPSPLVPAAQRSPCFPPPAFRQARNYGHLILHFRDGATRMSGLAYRERTGAANPRLGGRLACAKKRNPFCQPACASPDPEPVGHHITNRNSRRRTRSLDKYGRLLTLARLAMACCGPHASTKHLPIGIKAIGRPLR